MDEGGFVIGVDVVDVFAVGEVEAVCVERGVEGRAEVVEQVVGRR